MTAVGMDLYGARKSPSFLFSSFSPIVFPLHSKQGPIEFSQKQKAIKNAKATSWRILTKRKAQEVGLEQTLSMRWQQFKWKWMKPLFLLKCFYFFKYLGFKNIIQD